MAESQSAGANADFAFERDADSEEFQSLRRSLTRAAGFQLMIAVYHSPIRRDALIARLAQSIDDPLATVTIPPDCVDVVPVLAEHAATLPSSARVSLIGLEAGVKSDEYHPRMGALNLRREAIRAALTRPLLLWVPEYMLTVLGRDAPDFLNWRVGTWFFLEQRSPDSAMFSALRDDQRWTLTAVERRARVEQLKSWLLAASAEPRGKTVRWSLELADHLESLGEWDECLAICRELVNDPTVSDADRAEINGQIADILAARGELDEALRIRRQEVLPVYERLGDARSKAVVWGKIADILLLRGELDEALRIRGEKELAVHEELGDRRGRAITLGQIADVLFAMGERDESLRIQRDEMLPVFEQLGDVRSRAITLSKIADALFAMGKLDEALEIWRDELLGVFERLGDVRSQALTFGRIADVLDARGDLDEALRIKRDEVLPIVERLGDVRSRATLMLTIARVLIERGELDEAQRMLSDEVLPVFQRLRYLDGVANTLWSLAQIDLLRGHHAVALARLSDSYLMLNKLGRLDGVCEVGKCLGQLLVAAGKVREARPILTRSRDGYHQLGRHQEAAAVDRLIKELDFEHNTSSSPSDDN